MITIEKHKGVNVLRDYLLTIGTKISLMVGGRIHHLIDWQNAVPCIIDEKYKK